MSASEPNRPDLPPRTPSREELAVAPTQALRPDEPPSELANLLDEYLAELQSGRQPDRVKLLAEHPELATQLEQCLSGIEFIHRASGPAMKSGMPTQLGDFRIVREVGRGGMGVVYEAEQVSLKRRVALKVLRFGAASDTEAMQRFQREAETVATLHHTNIVPIFAIGCENGVNYYAMQFIEGRSLANVDESLRDSNSGHGVTRLQCAVADVANWGLQAAEALAHAHQRGVIHRDIKPSNLILDPDGRIWLTDFGLAKRMDDVSLSMAGAILGTPRYMSPEQAAASKNPVDHRTDIYSLGATLYELATGRPLFEGDSPHLVITQILTTEPPAPRVVCPGLHRDFETIILKCLAKEPERRYATAQALADDLRAFVEGRAIRARRSTLAEQAARWFKQQKRSVGIAAVTVAATIFVVIGSLIAWQMHGQAKLGYLTLNTPRDGNERAEVAEVLTLDDQPVGSLFTLPTKEPLALPEGAYRLRLTAPSKVSQTYLFDIAAGAQQTHDVGLVNETVGYAVPLRSPVGVEVSGTALAAGRRELPAASAVPLTTAEPRLFVGPQDSSKPTLRCYSIASQLQQHTVQEGSSINVVRSTEPTPLWEADWRLEAPDIVSFLKLPADRETWKVLPAQWDVFAWQQVLAWFDPSWFRSGSPPKVMQPARDLNGDGVDDVIWSAPKLANTAPGAFGPGPLTPKAAVLVAASGKDGKPLWWFRPQDSKGAACRLGTAPVWSGDVIVSVVRSVHDTDSRIEAVSPNTGESLWRHNAGTVGWSWLTTATIDGTPSVIAIIQDRLFVLDAATGEPKLGTPGYLDWSESGKIVVKPEDSTGLHKGTVLLADVRFADLDADGVPEVLLSVFFEDRRVDVVALSLARRDALWQVASSVNVGPNDPFQGSLPWQFVADLDGDDRPEVVLPNHSGGGAQSWTGCRVLNGATGELRWERRFPVHRGGGNFRLPADQYTVGPDLDDDGQRELVRVSVRSEFRPRTVGQNAIYHYEEFTLYVDCFSGRDGRSVWWQRIPFGSSELSRWTGTPETPIWWGESSPVAPRPESRMAADSQSSSQASKSLNRSAVLSRNDRATLPRLVLPVRRHADQGGDGIGNASARLLFVLSAETGRVEHSAENLALPQLVDWNNDGLDDLAVFVPDDPQEFANAHNWPYKPIGKFVVLRGSPPEAFRRLDRWTEEQDFDGDGIAEMSKRHDGSMGRMGDYAVLIASGRDGRLMSKWKTEWPETPRHFTVGNVQSFPPPLGDFDGDGLADLLITRDGAFQEFWDWESNPRPIVETGRSPLLMQAISSKTGRRVWGGGEFTVPDAFRPTSADVNSGPWLTMRHNRIEPRLTQAVDLDADGRPEVLQMVRLVGYASSGQPGGGALSERQEPFVALIDGHSGTVRWFESVTAIMTGEQLAAKFGLPDFIKGGGTHAPGLDHLRIDASTDLNGDGTRDLVLTMPQQLQQGSWLQMVQVHSGSDGKVLWGPKPLEGENFNNNDFNPPIISDLDGDGRPELVLMASKQPHVTVLRGDTGEQLWTWKGSQPPNFATPGIAVVASRLGLRPDPASSAKPDRTVGTESQPTKRCVAVAFNETGSQWDIALLDHEGQLIERVPAASNQLWSHDLDGDGSEELLRYVDTKLTASRGLHDVLWTWSRPASDYGWVSRFERTADGRAIVVTASLDSVTLLDGPTGKPLGRTFKSTNTSLHENGRLVDLNHANIATPFENSRLLTRVGDGPLALGHIVSRAVLPTDDDGRYQRSPVAPRQESRTGTDSQSSTLPSSKPFDHSADLSRSDRATIEDPRLVLNLPWVSSMGGLTSATFWSLLLVQVTRAVVLSLVILLIPYWLIRAAVRRRDLGRWRSMLIVTGLAVLTFGIIALRFLSRDPQGDLPLGPLLAMSVGGLALLAWPRALLSSLFRGDWRRVRWLLGGTLAASIALAAIVLSVASQWKSPEQHYSWQRWWLILLLGAFAVGMLMVLWQGIGPAVTWLWKRIRRSSAKVVTQ